MRLTGRVVDPLTCPYGVGSTLKLRPEGRREYRNTESSVGEGEGKERARRRTEGFDRERGRERE